MRPFTLNLFQKLLLALFISVAQVKDVTTLGFNNMVLMTSVSMMTYYTTLPQRQGTKASEQVL